MCNYYYRPLQLSSRAADAATHLVTTAGLFGGESIIGILLLYCARIQAANRPMMVAARLIAP